MLLLQQGRFRSVVRRSWTAALSLLLMGTAGCRAQQPWPLWKSYTARYLDAQGRVIDHAAGDRTTSEGESYAMFFALVTNDRPRFEKLLDWTTANLAQGDLTAHLPAWSWGQASDGSWRVLDPNSAADSDMWIAYSLCEAGRLWHNARYEKLGGLLAGRIAREEVADVPSLGTTLLPGNVGFHPSATTWYLNPSYMPPELLTYFAHRDPHGPWGAILASLPQVVETSGGFAMDWMAAGAAGIQPSAAPGVMASLQAGQAAPIPVGSYDAIRVYLWAGMADAGTPHVREVVQALHGMGQYLGTHGVPPEKVGPEGQVLGPNGPAGFSAAVIPYLEAAGLKQEANSQKARVEAMRDPQTGLYGQGGLYYDQNLVMFEEGWASGRFRFDANGALKTRWK